MSKRVYFIGGSYLGCYYVRCFLPLLANGWSGNYMGLKKQLKDPALVQGEMQKADVIVFHRADTAEHHRLAIMMKSLGKKIVFDNDDTFKLDKNHPFFGVDEKGFKENLRQKNNVINNFIRNCDLVTCSTKYLAKEYRELNNHVIVLPNCVNQDDWDLPLRNDGVKVRIGIVGSTAYTQDFGIIKDVIQKLDKDPRVQLVMFGLHKAKDRKANPRINSVLNKEYSFWDSLKNLEHAPWCEMVDYFTTLNELKLDMMLIPRSNNHFNKAKSNIKFLEASMLEIPCIVSSFKDAPYENDENLILIKDNKGWEEAIESLMDKDRRRDMGKKSHQYVLDNYNITKHAHLWAEAYNTL